MCKPDIVITYAGIALGIHDFVPIQSWTISSLSVRPPSETKTLEPEGIGLSPTSAVETASGSVTRMVANWEFQGGTKRMSSALSAALERGVKEAFIKPCDCNSTEAWTSGPWATTIRVDASSVPIATIKTNQFLVTSRSLELAKVQATMQATAQNLSTRPHERPDETSCISDEDGPPRTCSSFQRAARVGRRDLFSWGSRCCYLRFDWCWANGGPEILMRSRYPIIRGISSSQPRRHHSYGLILTEIDGIVS